MEEFWTISRTGNGLTVTSILLGKTIPISIGLANLSGTVSTVGLWFDFDDFGVDFTDDFGLVAELFILGCLDDGEEGFRDFFVFGGLDVDFIDDFDLVAEILTLGFLDDGDNDFKRNGWMLLFDCLTDDFDFGFACDFIYNGGMFDDDDDGFGLFCKLLDCKQLQPGKSNGCSLV